MHPVRHGNPPVPALRERASSFARRFECVPDGAVCARFWEFTPELGCIYDCHYCYLQKTLRFPSMAVPTHFTNYGKMLRDIERVLAKAYPRPVIFNMGELADSRALDDITGFSKVIVPFITSTPNGFLHMLSKSDNYENLVQVDPRDAQGHVRVIQAASVNPQPVVRAVEEGTPPLTRRVRAMAKLQEAGYRIRYRFDPVFFYGDLFWRRNGDAREQASLQATQAMYSAMMDVVFRHTQPEMVTLGTYRPSPGLTHHIEKNHPDSPVLRVHTTYQDGKCRIGEDRRAKLYGWFVQEIRRRSPRTKVALCKEPARLWRKVGLNPTPLECSCTLFAAERRQRMT